MRFVPMLLIVSVNISFFAPVELHSLYTELFLYVKGIDVIAVCPIE